MSDLTRAITEALDRRHHLNTADLAAHIAAALAPLIEARVREARKQGAIDGYALMRVQALADAEYECCASGHCEVCHG
jgi:hypothetical protein